MAKFLLETDKVTSTADTINKLESKVSDYSSTISGWDTSDGDGDGFNFNGAKSVISSNVDAIASKIQNTAKALNIVVESHSELQNALRLDGDGQTNQQNDAATDAKNDTPEEPETNQTPNLNDDETADFKYAKVDMPVKQNQDTNISPKPQTTETPKTTPKPKLAPAEVVAPNVKKKQEENKSKTEKTKTKEKEVKKEKSKNVNEIPKQTTTPTEPKVETPTVSQEEREETPIVSEEKHEEKPIVSEEKHEETPKVNDISYAIPKQEQLSEESKELLNNEATIDSLGYSKLGDRYVVAADSSLGKVGDVVRFTDNNGESTECVIGVNTVTGDNKNKMYFLVDENKTSANPINVNVDITSSKIENLGNYKAVSQATNAAVATGTINANSETVADDISDDTDEVEGDDSNG